MPFKSEKQRRYLWKFHPEIAKRWEDEGKSYIERKIKKKIKKIAKKMAKRK